MTEPKPLTKDMFVYRHCPDGRVTTLKYCAEFEVESALQGYKNKLREHKYLLEKELSKARGEYREYLIPRISQIEYDLIELDKWFEAFKEEK
jgi:hypothetical protein